MQTEIKTTPLTEAELTLSAKELRRDASAREALAESNPNWSERMICGLWSCSIIFVSVNWLGLSMSAGAVLAGCAGAIPYFYFEIRRLRRQVNALAHLVGRAERGDA